MNPTNGGENPQDSSWYKKWHDNPNHHLVHWVIFLVAGIVVLGIIFVLVRKPVQVALDLSSANTGTDKAQTKVPEFVSIPDRAKNADLVVSGKVLKSDVSLDTNDYGDKLITTHQTIVVNEWLKGSSNGTINIDIVGGTLDGITLKASDQPDPLEVGEQAIMFLRQKDNGRFDIAQAAISSEVDIDTGASAGLMKLDANGQTKEGNLTSAQVKAQLGGAQ